MSKDQKKIIIISPEAWGINFVSKHLYAANLSERNAVYFVNPAIGWSLLQWINFKIDTEVINPNLTVVSYRNLLPKLDKWPKWVQQSLFKIQANRIKKKIASGGFDIVWSFDPFRYFDFKGWSCGCRIYHTVDFHPASKFEADIIKHADHVFTVSDWISQELPMNGKTAVKFNHGADVQNFERALASGKTIEIPGQNKIKATYVGNFHQRIDYPLLIQLVKENPTVDFILIGPVKMNNLGSGNHISNSDLTTLESLSNAYFIGSVPSADIILYLVNSDINLVLFHESMKKTQCNTHKLMAYFASGKVVLSSDIYEYRNAETDLIQLCENNSEIPVRFKVILSNLPRHNALEKMKKRKDFARANSYQNLIRKIGTIISIEI